MEGEVFPTVWSAAPSGGRLLKYFPLIVLHSDMGHILAIPQKICRPRQFVLSFLFPSPRTSVRETINIKRDQWATRLSLTRCHGGGLFVCCIFVCVCVRDVQVHSCIH